VRRLVIAAGGIIASTGVVFAVLRVLPGDIATARLGIDATPAALAALRDQYGLNRPLVVQYFNWLGDAFRGDLGTSLVTGDSVRGDIVARLDVTVPLVVLSSLASILLATTIGRRAALRTKRLSGLVATSISQLGLAIPTFVVGVALVSIFAVRWQLLPAGGFPSDGWRSPIEASRSLILPFVSLAIAQTGMLVRFARSQSLDFVASDAFRTARSVGRSVDGALATASRLVLSPVLQVTALQLSTLLTGAVIVESVFSLPGLGSMLVRDIANRDVTKVQSTLLVVVVAVFAIRLLTDFIIDRLDPRRLA